jgi:Ca2+-binding RTX toxin-like protein
MSRPADVALSADGARIYVSGTDGTIKVYDADTGALVANWRVGTKLGAIDVSPDGSFLLAAEAEPISSSYADPWWGNRFTVAVYKIDTATGLVTTFLNSTSGYEWSYNDVAILADGTALLSQKALPGWSAWVTPEVLDIRTGTFTTINQSTRHNSILSDTPGGQGALFAQYNNSDAGLLLFRGGTTFAAAHEWYADNVSGFNQGAQAYNADAGLVAQHVPGNGLHVYDGSLKYRLDLSDRYPNWTSNVAALAFDAAGAFLFVLDTAADAIVQVRTSDWTIVQGLPVGTDLVGQFGDFGSRLLVGPQMRYFTVVTDSGLLQIDNPAASSTISGTDANETINGTGLADTLEGMGGNDFMLGGGGADRLDGGQGNDFLDGGAGEDVMAGGVDDDVYVVDSAGDMVSELAGGGDMDQVRTSLANYQLPDNVEQLIFTGSGNSVLRGNSADNVVNGGSGNDSIRLEQGGNDLAGGGAGNDVFFYGGALTAADTNNGGEGTDTLVLQGDYNLTFDPASLTLIEGMSLQSGSITRWGQSGANSYDYVLRTVDANVAAGQQLRVNAQSLKSGEDFTFDGSAETDGSFFIYAGMGVDTLTGGAGRDIFFFEAGRLGAGDRVNGGGGADAVVISGAPTGVDPLSITIATGSLSNVESISFNGRFASDPSATPSYELVLEAGNVAPGARLIVNGNSLGAGQSLSFDGSAETAGFFDLIGGAGGDRLVGGGAGDRLTGGGGADTLRGGAGGDTFRYFATSDSAVGSADRIEDFSFGSDLIHLGAIDADVATAGDQAFAFIGGEAFGGVAGQLRAEQRGASEWLIHGDVNGDGTADFELLVTAVNSGSFGAGDFVL